MKPSPSAADIADLRVKVEVYMELYRLMFTSVPPKAHILEDHAVEQYILHLENGLPLVVEQFVERNHQDGKRHDEQSKRIKDPQLRANNHARRKCLDNLGAIKRRQKLVHAAPVHKQRAGRKRKDSSNAPGGGVPPANPISPVPVRTGVPAGDARAGGGHARAETVTPPPRTKTAKRGKRTHHFRVLRE